MFYHILEIELTNGNKIIAFKASDQNLDWKIDAGAGEGYCYQLMLEIADYCQFLPFNIFTNQLNICYEHSLADVYIKDRHFETKLINRDHIISISSVDYFEIEDGKYY